MKAAVIHSFKQPVKLENVEIPVPKSNEILIKIKACGCCHTDLHEIDGDWPIKPHLPKCPGHEGVGVVVAVGDHVKNFKLGDNAGIPWLYGACGSCEFCNTGRENICQFQSTAGYTVDGAFREYAIALDSHAVMLPQDINFEQIAPFLCAGVTSYKSIKETECKPGQFLTIIGAAGGLGHLAVQYGKTMGLRVIAVDVGEDRLEYCKTIGAEFSFDATHANLLENVELVTQGGSHGVVCFAPICSAIYNAFCMCRRYGTLVCVGLPSDNMLQVPIFDLVMKRITIRGSIVGTRQDMIEALDFAVRGLVKCDVRTLPFDQINNAMDCLRQGKVKGRLVLTFDHQQQYAFK
jgi:propanol-preferring alcohol dehydrogenase